jgi:hypothetical protein
VNFHAQLPSPALHQRSDPANGRPPKALQPAES